MIEITISESALSYLKKMIAKEKGLGFRLSVKKTGCSGYSYLPAITHTINPADICLKKEEVMVYLDSSWETFFVGLYIDYKEEEKGGLKQKRLSFVNLKESGRCGCGESFQL